MHQAVPHLNFSNIPFFTKRFSTQFLHTESHLAFKKLFKLVSAKKTIVLTYGY